jgi:hypothetical protein
VFRPRNSQHNSRAGHPSSTPPRKVRAAGAPDLTNQHDLFWNFNTLVYQALVD